MAILKPLAVRFIPGDHFYVEVTSHDQEHLDAALRMCFAGGRNATHYRVTRVYSDQDGKASVNAAPSLLLAAPYQGSERDMIPLPYPIGANNAGRFVWDWLAVAERGQSPDIDGTVRPDAFTVRGGDMCPFSSACLDSNTIVIITPTWSVYGK
jgi:hypothetical protein